MEKVKIKTDTIQLDQFLKWANVVSTGGEAKYLIKSGLVKVNDQIEFRRSKQLKENDIIEVNSNLYKIYK